MTDTSNGNIIVEIQNKIASVTFSHPASNSFPSDLLQRLTDELNALSCDNDVNVVILQSEGKTFVLVLLLKNCFPSLILKLENNFFWLC